MKIQILAILTLLFTAGCGAQKLPKIKGNKEVKDIYETVDDFTAIEIWGDFEVTIKRGEINQYHLKIDENLISVVDISVFDKVLKVKPTHNIQNSKKLELNITYTSLDAITLHDNVTLETLNKVAVDELTFTALDDAEFELDILVQDAVFLLNGDSKGDVQLKGGKAKMAFNENSYLKGDLNLETLEVEINKRADVSLEGDVASLKLTATGTSDVKAKDLESETANLIASGKADIYVYASKTLDLYAQGKSNIYVYGNPDITVDGLNDKSQIIKK